MIVHLIGLYYWHGTVYSLLAALGLSQHRIGTVFPIYSALINSCVLYRE